MKLFLIFGLVFILFLSGCIGPVPPPADKCSKSSECICGMHSSGNCIIGNKEFVEADEQCADYCDSFESIKCEKNHCIGIELSDEKFCDEDSDCDCGIHYETKECFFGNKNFVNTTTQCPDFCTGIHGQFKIKCTDNKCTQTMEDKPLAMLIIGSPSQEFQSVLNKSQDLVRYDVRSIDRLKINIIEILAHYDIVVLDQHLEAKKEVSKELGEAIQKYVSSGGKFILVMDSGIKRTEDSEILGWEENFGDIVPVKCYYDEVSSNPSCLNKIYVTGRIYRDDWKHPIMKGIEFAPIEGGAYMLETFPVSVTGKQVAGIEQLFESQSERYPGIVEKKLVIGKSIYFGYDPGTSKEIFIATLEYLK